MADLERFPIQLSLTDPQECQEAARKILEKLKPDWKQDELTFEIFTAGITNKIFSASVSDEEKVIFRVFGNNTEKIIDRKNELKSWRALAEKGLAAPLLGLFSNGIICGYLPGKSLNVQSVREPKMQSKIAEAMARIHQIRSTAEEMKPCVFEKIHNFISNISSTFESAEKQKQFDDYFANIDFTAESENLASMVLRLDPEVGFCHNDLLVHNILYDEKSDRLSFIDYEYADFNYTAFDVGNHFCEWGGVDDVDFSRCPTIDERREWLRVYLKFKNPSDKLVKEEILEEEVFRTDLFMALSHHFWSIWAIVQAQNSTIDFDYMSYAILRHRTYKEHLLRYLTN